MAPGSLPKGCFDAANAHPRHFAKPSPTSSAQACEGGHFPRATKRCRRSCSRHRQNHRAQVTNHRFLFVCRVAVVRVPWPNSPIPISERVPRIFQPAATVTPVEGGFETEIRICCDARRRSRDECSSIAVGLTHPCRDWVSNRAEIIPARIGPHLRRFADWMFWRFEETNGALLLSEDAPLESIEDTQAEARPHRRAKI